MGAVLDIHGRCFELMEADEFTLQYMEANRAVFPQADWQIALDTVHAHIRGETLGWSQLFWQLAGWSYCKPAAGRVGLEQSLPCPAGALAECSGPEMQRVSAATSAGTLVASAVAPRATCDA